MARDAGAAESLDGVASFRLDDDLSESGSFLGSLLVEGLARRERTRHVYFMGPPEHWFETVVYRNIDVPYCMNV